MDLQIDALVTPDREKMQDLTDETLMGRVATGDHAAFRALVDRHVARATALAYRILGRRAEAEEVVQEAFLRVWTTAPRWNLDGALFRTWFSRVLTNLCIDRRRRPRMDPMEAAGDPADPSPGADAAIEERQRGALVAAAMAELPERQRVALALCYWQEMSNIEAAEVMQISVGAVESLLVRARRSLKEKLAHRLGRSEQG
ncbi:MAG: RNA polymerase sigma factor [Alphaproteobacteria bacterium]|nr:RNA polymerase sigma factor [Alphaproteobacteria bacterium]